MAAAKKSETKIACGAVAIVGRPNVGKSTLLNALLARHASIVSHRAQTTRRIVRGVLADADSRIVLMDTPGWQDRRRSTLHRALNAAAAGAPQMADAALFVIAANSWTRSDTAIIADLPETNCIAVVNKVDTVSDKSTLLPFLQKLQEAHNFTAFVPVSARTGRGLPALLKEIKKMLPLAPLARGDSAGDIQAEEDGEQLRYAEFVREQLSRKLGDELPYAAVVVTEAIFNAEDEVRVQAAIIVERDSQKDIVLGARGARLLRIAAAAEKNIARAAGRPARLHLVVQVRRDWRKKPALFAKLGIGG